MVMDRPFIQGVDERAPVKLDRHPSFALQRDQRLTDGDAAHPKFLGDLILGYPCAGRKVSVEDAPSDVKSHLLAATGADDRIGAAGGPASRSWASNGRRRHSNIISRPLSPPSPRGRHATAAGRFGMEIAERRRA